MLRRAVMSSHVWPPKWMLALLMMKKLLAVRWPLLMAVMMKSRKSHSVFESFVMQMKKGFSQLERLRSRVREYEVLSWLVEVV